MKERCVSSAPLGCPVEPLVIRFRPEIGSEFGRATLANSITLTPGTITIEASEKGSSLWVHALERSSAEGFADDEMNHWVAWFEAEQR